MRTDWCDGSGRYVGTGVGLAAEGPLRLVLSHARKDDKFICPICGRAFRLRKNKTLPRHVRHPLVR